MLKKITLFLIAHSIITASDYQDFSMQTNFHQPIEFTNNGIKFFLQNIYNAHDYKNFFCNDFTHLNQFIKFGSKTDQGLEYLEEVIRIFRQKMMSCDYINASQLICVLNKLMKHCKNYFRDFNTTDQQNALNEVKTLLYNELSTKFDKFKQDPKKFIDDTSEKICAIAFDRNHVNELKAQYSKLLIIRFLETGISKLLWMAEDSVYTWQEFKKLGDQLMEMRKADIIFDDLDLNEVSKCLVERFTYFLDIVGDELPNSFFEQARNELFTQKLSWLELSELEEGLTTKSDLLRNALMQAQIKAEAKRTLGIVY